MTSMGIYTTGAYPHICRNGLIRGLNVKNTLKFVLKAIVLIAAFASSPTLAQSQRGGLHDLILRPAGDMVVGKPLSVKSEVAGTDVFREQQLSRHCIDAFLSTANDAVVLPVTTSFGVGENGIKTVSFSGPLIPSSPLVILRIISTCPYQAGEVSYKLATRVAEIVTFDSPASISALEARPIHPRRFDFSKSDQLKESYTRPKQIISRPTPQVQVDGFNAALPENTLNHIKDNQDSSVEKGPEPIVAEESSSLLKAEMPLQTEVFLPVDVPSLPTAQSKTGNASLPSRLAIISDESRFVYIAVIAVTLAICLAAFFMHWRGVSAVGGLLQRRSSLSEPKVIAGVEAGRFGGSVIFDGNSDKSLSNHVFSEDLEFEQVEEDEADEGALAEDRTDQVAREKVLQDYFIHDLVKIVQGVSLKSWHVPAEVSLSLNLSESFIHSIGSVPSWLRSYVALVECCFRRAQEGVLIRDMDVDLIVGAINAAEISQAGAISPQSMPMVVDLLDARLLELPSNKSKKAFIENLNALPKMTHGKAISFDQNSWGELLEGLAL